MSIEDGSNGVAMATAQCNLFTMKYTLPPCLSATLETTLTMMSTNPTETQLREFIDTFGTHAIRKVNMGAKFVSTATFDKKTAIDQKENGKSLSMSGGVSGWGFSAGGSYSETSSDTTRETTNGMVTETGQYTIGTTLPGGRDLAERLSLWAKNDAKIMAHPMPIGGMTLAPIADEIERSK